MRIFSIFVMRNSRFKAVILEGIAAFPFLYPFLLESLIGFQQSTTAYYNEKGPALSPGLMLYVSCWVVVPLQSDLIQIYEKNCRESRLTRQNDSK